MAVRTRLILGSQRLLGASIAVMLILVLPALARGAVPAAQVAETYSPVLSLAPQPKACGSGEAYRPTTVNIVLGRQDVLLRDPHGKIVRRAPTSPDLWGLGPGYYVDFPGNPLNPGCGYERQFRDWNHGRPPSVYAHVATDPSHPGKLAVEYWFYYTFNDFTDKHESDWEMAQVDFDAPTAAKALRAGPYEVDLSQHAGGERAAWTSTKLQKQGTHPVIYDATGSHANYFGRALYLGRGAREGFGCDDTRNATLRLEPRTVLLPDIPSSASASYAWLGSKDAGARGNEASTTARPVRQRKSNGSPRSSGRTGCAKRASKSRAARRSV